jgi:FkbM family methyltransferase
MMKIRDLFAAEDRTAIEKYCRDQTQQGYLGDHTALARVLGRFLMYVDTRDLSLTPHLLMNGYWEMWVTQAIVDYVRPGMRCIDVGANVGYYSILLAELVGAEGFVTAYEPQERAYELLNKTARVNGARLVICEGAASSFCGNAELYTNPRLLGSASLAHAESLNASPDLIVRVTLDSMHRDTVDFVKIDAQGHEMQVLQGMQEVIRRSPKIAIAMEFSPSEHESPRASLETIQGYGLQIRTIGTDGTVRPIALEDAAKADTGDHRMLWLSKG